MSRLRFGIFMAPFHSPVGQDPTSAYERDLDVIKQLDKLGFDEAWIGEHHSCGHETIPDPMIFIAHAANHTRHIRLGTGVVSLPYHNPLWVADRA
ncbi:MAG: limonene 1,2-monooxygenase, partial [Pseudonocardiales bacterium]|nr:limonene 1,2-monooxygenase [Pseudonocardiales bacterium]